MLIDSLPEARPSFVTFEYVAEEDRTATLANGHYTSKDVAYAFITPQGSKDRIVRKADEWLEQLQQQVREGRMPADWERAYVNAYKAWKSGLEIPVSGMSLRNWPAASPAQIKTLLDMNIRTVEELAAANEEALSRIGMGGRALKQLATEWLSSARNVGRHAEEMAALRVENAELHSAQAEANLRLAALEHQLKSLRGAAVAVEAEAEEA